MSYDMDSRYYTCCCGPFRTHVEKGAYVIAFLGCILNVFEAYVSFLPSSNFHGQSVKSGMMYLLSAFMYLSIIAAQQKRRPGYYVPYLVFEGIGLILAALVCFLLAAAVITAPQFMIDEFSKEHPHDKMTVGTFRFLAGLSALAYGLSIALNGWFYSVIYRAYKYMKLDNGQYGMQYV